MKRMRLFLAIAPCLVAAAIPPASTAEDKVLKPGRYSGSFPGGYVTGTLDIASIDGGQVKATWTTTPHKKIPCTGLKHDVSGTLNGSDLTLAEAPGTAGVRGCESSIKLHVDGDILSGDVSGYHLVLKP